MVRFRIVFIVLAVVMFVPSNARGLARSPRTSVLMLLPMPMPKTREPSALMRFAPRIAPSTSSLLVVPPLFASPAW